MAARGVYQVLAACMLAAGTIFCVEGLLRVDTDSGLLDGADVAASRPTAAVAGIALLQRKKALAFRKETVHFRGTEEDADAASAAKGGLASEVRHAEEMAEGLLHKAESVLHYPVQTPPSSSSDSDIVVQIGTIPRILIQLGLGGLYYLLIASKYPVLPEGAEITEDAQRVMRKGEIGATLEAQGANCIHAFCCSAPRAAQTWHSTGVLSYWWGLLSMSIFPCCTLFAVNYGTDVHERLGGKKKDCCMSCLCAMCCSCCVITQDAESLDRLTGATPSLCSVSMPDP